MTRWDDANPPTREELRDEIRNVLATVLLVTALLVSLAWCARAETATPEVTLAPVTVQMADPIPCERDPEVRQLYVELGVTCRSLDR